MVGASGTSRPTTTEAMADADITDTRPNRSDSTLAGITASASMPVVAETARAAPAGVRSKLAGQLGQAGLGGIHRD